MSNINHLGIEKPTMTGAEMQKFRIETCHMDEKFFAALMGVTPQAVKLWETNQRRIPETTVRLISLFKRYPEVMGKF